ncbi:MAG: hypothetical protein R6V62_11505 [Candidatus Fermentibacteraceae bacterium]
MPRSRSRAFSWRTILVLAGIFLFSELASRAYLLVRGFPAYRYVQTNSALRQARARGADEFDTDYPYLSFTPAAGHSAGGLSVNSMGFIGPETGWLPEQGVFRVLCMGGSMVYDGVFPLVMGQRLDSLLASGELPYGSCEVLMLTAPTWTSAENLAAYCAMGVYAQPHAIVLYVAVNDVYAMFRPDTVVAQPDYSHFRERWNPVPAVPWDIIPGWADSSRAVALARYGLDRVFQARYQAAPPKRLGLRYDFNPEQVLDTTFASYECNLEAITTIAESRGTIVFLVSELQLPGESGGDAMVAGVERLNTIAGRVAGRHSRSGLTHFVDAAGIIPATELTLSDKSHLTPEGNRLLGELIADSLHSALRTGGVR